MGGQRQGRRRGRDPGPLAAAIAAALVLALSGVGGMACGKRAERGEGGAGGAGGSAGGGTRAVGEGECAVEDVCTKPHDGGTMAAVPALTGSADAPAIASAEAPLDEARIATLPGVLWYQAEAAGTGVVRLAGGVRTTVAPVFVDATGAALAAPWTSASLTVGAAGPDGGVAAIATSESAGLARLAMVEASGARATLLGPAFAQLRFPVVGHGWIAFDARAGAPPDDHSELYRFDLAARALTRLTTNAEGNFRPRRLDATTLVFESSRDGDGEIYKLPAAGGAATRLTAFHRDDFDPVPAPDGKTIAFVSDREGRPRIFLVAADGTALRRLTTRTDDALEEMAPAWSPDGTAIAYVAERATGGEIYVHPVGPRRTAGAHSASAAGSIAAERRASAVDARETDPKFSPDGAWLVVRRLAGAQTDLVAYSLAGAPELRLTSTPGAESLSLWTP